MLSCLSRDSFNNARFERATSTSDLPLRTLAPAGIGKEWQWHWKMYKRAASLQLQLLVCTKKTKSLPPDTFYTAKNIPKLRLQPGHRWGRLQSSPDPIARFKGGGRFASEKEKQSGEGRRKGRRERGRGGMERKLKG